MKFTVVWMRHLELKLAKIWNEAPDRQAVTNAVDVIDRQLSFDAMRQGRPTGDGLRVLTKKPIEVLFEVSVDDRIARVIAVNYLDPRAGERN
ncbi:MAG: hypothetical protein AABP62_21605 [Planctomycetota bacterium]